MEENLEAQEIENEIRNNVLERSNSYEKLVEKESTENNIINHYSLLCEHLSNISQVLVHLVENRIFSFHEMEDIKKYATSLERNSAFFDLLLRKDWENVQDLVIQIFQETSNGHIAAIISGTERSPQKIMKSSNKMIITVITISCVLLIATIVGTMLYLKLRPQKRILQEKWWPRKMNSVNSFYDRKLNGTDILLVEGLHATLKSPDTNNEFTRQKIVIDGLPGVGKTETAIWFANYYNNDYEYIIWVSCEKESLHVSLMNLARQLNIPGREELDHGTLAQQIFAKFGQTTCLWIFDYAEYDDNENSGIIGIKDILFELKYPNFDTIKTSVNSFWGRESDYGKIQNFTLSPFNNFESVIFLKANLGNRAAEPMYAENLVTLAGILDNFPLALQIAVNTLNDVPEESLEDFIDNVGEILNSTDHLPNYGKTIYTTMKISIDSIKDMDYGELAFEILKAFGYLRPENIDMKFFGSIFQCDVETDLKEALNLLERRFLIGVKEKDTIDFPGKQSLGTLSMHRLLQLFMRTFVNETNTEKETLIKILEAKDFVLYKLTPYAEYAVKYEDLEKIFKNLRAELLEQLQLVDFLHRKQYEEAVLLSQIIHNGYTSGNGFLNSAKNYGLCLHKAGSLEAALKIFEMLNTTLDWEEMHNYCGINLNLTNRMSKLEISLWGIDLLKRVGEINESVELEKGMIDALNRWPDGMYSIQDYIDPIDLSIFRQVKSLLISYSQVYLDINADKNEDEVIKENIFFHGVSFVNIQGNFLTNVNFSQIPYTRTNQLYLNCDGSVQGFSVSYVNIDVSELYRNTSQVALMHTDFVCSKDNPYILNLVLLQVRNLRNSSIHLYKLKNLQALKIVSSSFPLPNNSFGFYRVPSLAFIDATFILSENSIFPIRKLPNDFVMDLLTIHHCSFTDENNNLIPLLNFTDLNINAKMLTISMHEYDLNHLLESLIPSNLKVDLSKLTHTEQLLLDSVEISCTLNIPISNILYLTLWNVSNVVINTCLPKLTNLYFMYLDSCDSNLDFSKLPSSIGYLHLTNISVQNNSTTRLSFYFLENYSLENHSQRSKFFNAVNGIQTDCLMILFDYSLCQTERWSNNKNKMRSLIKDRIKIAFGAVGCKNSDLKTVLNLAEYGISHSSDFYAIENGKGKAIRGTELYNFCPRHLESLSDPADDYMFTLNDPTLQLI